MSDEPMSLAMFWAGVLMVFTPIVSAALVVGTWWFTTKRKERVANPPTPDLPR